eukprot:sb/3469883/
MNCMSGFLMFSRYPDNQARIWDFGSPPDNSDSQDKSQDSPDSPDKSPDSPDKCPDSPDKSQDSPDKSPDSPDKCPDSQDNPDFYPDFCPDYLDFYPDYLDIYPDFSLQRNAINCLIYVVSIGRFSQNIASVLKYFHMHSYTADAGLYIYSISICTKIDERTVSTKTCRHTVQTTSKQRQFNSIQTAAGSGMHRNKHIISRKPATLDKTGWGYRVVQHG